MCRNISVTVVPLYCSLLLSGATPPESGSNFKEWLFTELCTQTPLNVETNGVLLCVRNNRKIYSHDCLKSLRRDELTQVLVIMRGLLAQINPPPLRLLLGVQGRRELGCRWGWFIFVRGGTLGGESWGLVWNISPVASSGQISPTAPQPQGVSENTEWTQMNTEWTQMNTCTQDTCMFHERFRYNNMHMI